MIFNRNYERFGFLNYYNFDAHIYEHIKKLTWVFQKKGLKVFQKGFHEYFKKHNCWSNMQKTDFFTTNSFISH